MVNLETKRKNLQMLSAPHGKRTKQSDHKQYQRFRGVKKLSFCISVFSFCLLGCCGYWYFLKKNNLPNRAFHCIREGDFEEAKRLVQNDSKKNPLSHLCLGYCYQVEGNFEEANYCFERVLLRHQSNQTLREEALLALTENCVLENNLERANAYLKKVNLQNRYYHYLDGLLAYLAKNYAKAEQRWALMEGHVHGEEFFGSGVFPILFDRLFPFEMQQIQLGHCCLELGDTERARNYLEYFHDNVLALIYIGKSYLMDGPAYYQLACQYFERANPKQESTWISTLAAQISDVILNSPSLDLIYTAELADLIHLLEKWKQHVWLEKIAAQVAHTSLDPYTCACLRKTYQPGFFHAFLVQHLLNSMQQSFQCFDLDTSFTIWSKLNDLADNTQETVSAMTLETILRAVSEDNANLMELVQFWLSIPQDEMTRIRLIRHLLAHAQQAWNTEGGEVKGMRLMAIVHKLSDSQPEIIKEIEDFLVELFKKAESNNMIERLALIHDALCFFRLDGSLLPIAISENLENYLADAHYLFHSQKFASARSHAIWILKLDPMNQEALRLAGLSSFYLGDYTCAHFALTKIAEHDESSATALKLSQIFSSSPPPEYETHD